MLVPVFCLHQALFLLDPAFPFSPAQLRQVVSVLLSVKIQQKRKIESCLFQ